MGDNYQCDLKYYFLKDSKIIDFLKLYQRIYWVQKVDAYPSKAKFAQIIGTLNRDEQLSTFVTSNVDTNWKEPQSAEHPYLLFFDQALIKFDQIS